LKLNTELITTACCWTNARHGAERSGLDTLVVSIDGAQGAVLGDIRPGADLGTIDKNVRRLMALPHRPKLGLEFVPAAQPCRLPRLPELARRWGAEFVIVSNLLPPTAEMKNEILYWLASQSLSPTTCTARTRKSASRHRHPARPGGGRSARSPRTSPAAPGRRRWTTGWPAVPFVEEGAATIGWDGGVGRASR
jgi:hypothetical protein